MAQLYLAMNRFGLGWRAGDAPLAGDPRAALRQQLVRYDPAPPLIAALPPRAALVTEVREYRDDRAAEREAAAQNADMAAERQMGQGRAIRANYLAAAAARLEQAATTATPFAERLVHFWANHFAVSVQSLPVAVLAGDHENRAIRPHIMGKFADLLKAAVLHPAMLLFLDQAQSVGPNSPLAQRAGRRAEANGRKLGLNENLAREILELHTLGVRSVYAQADVTALARALTGWTVAGLGQRADRLLERMGGSASPGDALFLAAMHEPGAQTIIGQRFAGEGAAQSLAALDHLASHPATAKHVATKLARHFAADVPPPALVARLEAAFLASGGDLPTLYRVLIDAPECWAAAAPKFKTPWDWTVSMLRATGLKQLPDRRGAVGALEQLGQPIWRPGSPAGYDDIADRWAGPSGLMLRAELAARIAGGIAERADPRAWSAAMLADAATPATLNAIARADSAAQGVTLALMAPEFLRR
jgi:uncharacterized protein (DUF1800 family)